MNTAEFDAYTIDLSGANLIEASAGTGKTYSIALLSLRMIVEKDIPIHQQLIVTFTQNAVAELEERLRKFIRIAYQYTQTGTIEEEMNDIGQWIDRLVKSSKISLDTIASNLYKAVNSLDNIPVMTIHKFCRNVLTDYALECRHMYAVEIIEDLDEIIDQGLAKYWREQVATLDPLILQILTPPDQNRLKDIHLENLKELVKKALSGKKWLYSNADPSHILGTIAGYEAYFKQKDWRSFLEERYRSKIKSFTSKKQLEYLNHCESLRIFLSKFSQSTTLFNTVFESELDWFHDLKKQVQLFKNYCFGHALKEVLPTIKNQLKKHKLISHDQSILEVYQELLPQEEAVHKQQQQQLIEGLNKQFRSVFVDEFQDTDRYQFQIFQGLFAKHATSVFYIGDPKQSIYAWRQADLNTYLKARKKCQIYQMNINYRSAANYVESMNHFFAPRPNFDAFHQSKVPVEQQINYLDVAAKQADEHIILAQQLRAPLNLIKAPFKQDIMVAKTAQLVLALLHEGRWQKNERAVLPEDIAILVRSNQQAALLEVALQSLGIPSQLPNNTSIYAAAITPYIAYILEAWQVLSERKITKGLINPLTGFVLTDIPNFALKKLLERFKSYQSTWIEKGVYPALIQYFNDFNCAEQLSKNNPKNAARYISDFYQLAEALHEVGQKKKYTGIELIGHLQQSIVGLKSEKTDLQRPVDKKSALQIMTVHKSKGLEFNLVIAPFLDLTSSQKSLFREFRNEQGVYCICTKHQTDYQELWQEQLEQENRRLIYVALTRAKYATFIFKNKYTSSLTPFSDALEQHYPSYIHTFDSILKNINIDRTYILKPTKSTPANLSLTSKPKLKDRYYRSMSYSYLAGPHQYHDKPYSETNYTAQSYDQFVFYNLPRGIKAGELLHEIFEWIDWTNKDQNRWNRIIEVALQKYGFLDQKKELQVQLVGLIDVVVNGRISIDKKLFKLSTIDRTKSIAELEFNFKTSTFTIEQLTSLEAYLPDGFRIQHKQNDRIEGMLHGFIDLFFEYENQFYILDWKSNFLGTTVEDYQKNALIEAMSVNNYHLQYLIYCLAVHKYLRLKIKNYRYEKDFGGLIYVFMRGVRPDKQEGFFCYKPSYACIKRLNEIFSGGIKQATIE